MSSDFIADSTSPVKRCGTVWRSGGRQAFPALELGPGCLVLGINGGPPLAEGPLGASG